MDCPLITKGRSTHSYNVLKLSTLTIHTISAIIICNSFVITVFEKQNFLTNIFTRNMMMVLYTQQECQRDKLDNCKRKFLTVTVIYHFKILLITANTGEMM